MMDGKRKLWLMAVLHLQIFLQKYLYAKYGNLKSKNYTIFKSPLSCSYRRDKKLLSGQLLPAGK